MKNPWDQRLGFWWIAEDRPDAPAIVASPDGPRTYGELAGDAHQIAHLLRSLGVTPGAVIAAMLDNGSTLIETSLAVHESGIHLIPLNTHLTGAELTAIIEHSGTRVLIVEQRFVPLLASIDHSKVTVLVHGAIDHEGAGIRSLLHARAVHPRTAPTDRSPGGLFVYTSGTTGRPKGIRRTIPEGDVGQIANDGALFSRAFDFRPHDGPMLVSTGMFHGAAHSFYMGGLHAGHGLVIMDRFDPEAALRLIETHQVRTGYMVPTQFHRFVRLPEATRSKYDVSSLHSIVHSAAPCPRDLKEQMMAWWGPVIWETYGGMEGAATIAKPHRWLEKPGTVGRAVRGVELTILDDEGNELPRGEVGQIYMHNGVGFRYHDDPDQTASAHHGKRFSLGDIGYLDDDGYLFVADRAKDMIIVGGTNVYPAEIEAVLMRHPKVGDVGVTGLPDPDWGEMVVALVEPADGIVGSDDLGAELFAFCKDHLASFKCPRRWEFRDDLDRTEAGKLSKRKMRDQLLAADAATPNERWCS